MDNDQRFAVQEIRKLRNSLLESLRGYEIIRIQVY
jgi:hypothetical protein